jgi:hypothetical protein
VQHIRENVAAVALNEHEMEVVDAIITKNPIAGARYHPHGMKMVNM